jgi:hypothetical protein
MCAFDEGRSGLRFLIGIVDREHHTVLVECRDGLGEEPRRAHSDVVITKWRLMKAEGCIRFRPYAGRGDREDGEIYAGFVHRLQTQIIEVSEAALNVGQQRVAAGCSSSATLRVAPAAFTPAPNAWVTAIPTPPVISSRRPRLASRNIVLSLSGRGTGEGPPV